MLLAATCCLALSAAIQSSRITLGSTWTAQETLHIVNSDSEIDETHRYKLDYRVLSRDKDAWVIDRKSYLTSSKIGDQELGPPPTTYPDITKEWVSAAGYLLDNEPMERGVFNMERLTTFWLPENNPDEWTVELSESLKHFASISRAEFKFVRKDETTRTYALTFTPTYAPEAMTATGRLRFDTKTGRLVEANVEAKHSFVPGGVDLGEITLKYSSPYS